MNIDPVKASRYASATFSFVLNVCDKYDDDELYKKFGDILDETCVMDGCCNVEFIITKVRRIYSKANGCPSGGEVAFKFEANFDRYYEDCYREWEKSCFSYIKLLIRHFNQKNMSIALTTGAGHKIYHITTD